jgi:hypothetical protein
MRKHRREREQTGAKRERERKQQKRGKIQQARNQSLNKENERKRHTPFNSDKRSISILFGFKGFLIDLDFRRSQLLNLLLLYSPSLHNLFSLLALSLVVRF